MTNLPEHINDERFCGQAVAYGLTGDGREVVVLPRIYNTIITIGPAGEMWLTEHW